MSKRLVEVFTAGCPLCDETVKLVRELACSNCEVQVYDLREGYATNSCRERATQYGIHRVPAVVVVAGPEVKVDIVEGVARSTAAAEAYGCTMS